MRDEHERPFARKWCNDRLGKRDQFGREQQRVGERKGHGRRERVHERQFSNQRGQFRKQLGWRRVGQREQFRKRQFQRQQQCRGWQRLRKR